MASIHASYRAKANLELIELARSLRVNLRVVRAQSNYLVLSITAIYRWEGKSAIEWHQKYCLFREITTVKLCLWLFTQTYFHCWDAVRLSLLWSENTVKGDCSAVSPRSRLLCLGCIRPARLPGPFTETVLGLIIPSCASSPSPAGLRVPVSSAKTPQLHRSQGETEKHTHDRSAHLWTHLKSNVRHWFLHHWGRIVSVLLCCAASTLHAGCRRGGATN